MEAGPAQHRRTSTSDLPRRIFFLQIKHANILVLTGSYYMYVQRFYIERAAYFLNDNKYDSSVASMEPAAGLHWVSWACFGERSVFSNHWHPVGSAIQGFHRA
jgi:hypothetical protein